MRPLRPFVIILLLTLVAVVAYLVSATPASPEPSVPTSTTAAQAPPPASAPAPTSTTAAPAPPPTAPRPSQALSGASQGTPAPTTPHAPAVTGCRWEQTIRDIWPDDSEAWALSIVWRESRCDENAVSPTGCRGLWQVALPLHADLFAAQGLDWQTSWNDPVANTRAALLLFQSSGTSPWRM